MADTSEEYEDSFLDIEELQNHGIGMADITKLKSAGIHTVQGAVMTTRRSLLKLKGFSEVKVEKVKEACAKLIPAASFQSASEIAQTRRRVCSISTGSKAFDAMLGGGVMTSSLTEVFGEFRTGKSQLCHTMCVAAQLPKSLGGAEGKAAFIDTEGTFRPERCRAIAERFGVDGDAALENIVCNRAYTSEQQQEAIDKVCGLFASDGNFRLLIVDSIMALFRVDYSGRGELADRQQKLGIMLSRLTKLSEEFNVAVFVTNQVQSDPGAAAMFASADRKPIGGHVMAHASATRILLRKGRGEERVAKIQDSPEVAEGECVYVIKAGGICDSE